MPTPRHPRFRRSTAWAAHPATGICQRFGLTVYVGSAFLGLLAAPLATLGDASTLTACIVSACVTGYRAYSQNWPTMRTLWVWGSITFALPYFLAGTRVLGDTASLVAWALPTLALILACVNTLRRGLPPGPAGGHGGSSPWDGAGGDALPRAVLATVPLDVLLAKWRASQGEQQRVLPQRELEAICWVRELLIDELQRRDPVGVERWLTAGAGEPPERYIGIDRRRDG